MTDVQGQGAPAPGWYADPTGQAGVRWWDGGQWTAYTAPLPAGGPAGPASITTRPMLPPSTPIYTPFIWLIVLLPLLSVVALFLWQPSLHLIRIGGTQTVDPLSVVGPGIFIAQALSLLLYALNVVFAVLDHRALERAGVLRPFHWAWAFLNPVYPIGRSVIVHQVARPRGLAPVWVVIGTYLVSVIVALVWSLVLVGQLGTQLSGLTTAS